MTAGFIQPTAICRHGAGDPDCSSNRSSYDNRYESIGTASAPKTPDADDYHVESAVEVGKHLVLKVRYPNCSNCSYEGNKVMVFVNTTALDALKWKKLDPHFRGSRITRATSTAPSPAARFPASPDGWNDAIAYARSKT